MASQYTLAYAVLEIAVFVAFGALTFWWSRRTKQAPHATKQHEL